MRRRMHTCTQQQDEQTESKPPPVDISQCPPGSDITVTTLKLGFLLFVALMHSHLALHSSFNASMQRAFIGISSCISIHLHFQPIQDLVDMQTRTLTYRVSWCVKNSRLTLYSYWIDCPTQYYRVDIRIKRSRSLNVGLWVSAGHELIVYLPVGADEQQHEINNAAGN